MPSYMVCTFEAYVEVRGMYHLPHVRESLGRSSKNELDVSLGDAAALVSQRT